MVERQVPLRELEDAWGKSNSSLRRMIRAGSLRAFKLGATWRVPVSEVERVTHLQDEEDAAA